jgi:ABC-type multidrug transport system ATPase subunit
LYVYRCLGNIGPERGRKGTDEINGYIGKSTVILLNARQYSFLFPQLVRCSSCFQSSNQTTLISALTLDAFYGRPIGSVTLNGVPLTDKIFKEHCYVVVQNDKHWPYFTCREILRYAAELYDVAPLADMDGVVDEILAKMGLVICRNTRTARLSGGQRRRLSLGIALLKRPTLLFLDEPTTGVDAAAAVKLMQEIVTVAKNEHLIVMCTIHQPSTKVYNGFDEVMILSKGRVGFSGPVGDAIPYLDSVGHPLPVQTNPAGASMQSSQNDSYFYGHSSY